MFYPEPGSSLKMEMVPFIFRNGEAFSPEVSHFIHFPEAEAHFSLLGLKPLLSLLFYFLI